ncbi:MULTISPECIES: O-phospho-L-seryl-tRNA:Cys-tRNA synthase [unclassified Methanoregula]|uniref:O-phospho-L-seryl-tRNA:Cys-tRNA synthase n=1 Tax=unclassified Methanoregula TaxID=2649730 RepID=UPI0009D24ABF|nr:MULTISPECIES: O-phospho-L-seryl-tRNA:Cys-tRNA synthase [unclassified Methanoregula]OPX65262.1 MAG: O-phospho-L-seryl-tRNA:Cys-tRNA synthase [Methanoregula sp. PtaB.Bin085]OPY32171.1 MAG: O-phospho-L-seryl-tRNA:Cys-tRNA synthase [Methanoregula sp. PtaU1.Bin006]
MKCASGIEARQVDELFINIDPIQAGGRLTAEAMKAVIAYGDGYSVCDNCRKPNRLDYIAKPPIAEFHKDVAKWLNMDAVRTVPGARRGFQAVAQTYVKKGDPVLLTSLSHYTEFLAIEEAGGVAREIPANDQKLVTPDAAAAKIEAVKKELGKAPVLAFIDHVDYQYGNLHDFAAIAKVAHQYDIPVVYNGAYTVGILPVDGKALGADFVVGSGHKSMAAPAPSGILAVTAEREKEVFRTTAIVGDVTNRKFGIKEPEMIGCTLMGATLIGMMASFPHVRQRTKHFDRELANHAVVMDALLSIEGTKCLSEYPRKHTMTRVDTTASFDRIAESHKKRGYFLQSALEERGVTGVIPGATKVWKFNTYGTTHKQALHLAKAFVEIARENGLAVKG